jgi:hypothetical protein
VGSEDDGDMVGATVGLVDGLDVGAQVTPQHVC